MCCSSPFTWRRSHPTAIPSGAPPLRETSWNRHDHLDLEGSGLLRSSQESRQRLPLFLVDLEHGGEGVADMVHRVSDRVALGDQFGQKGGGHGEPTFGLRIRYKR